MRSALAGYRILVLEDEFFLAAELEDLLTEVGADVIGPIGSLQEALTRVGTNDLDLAILDIALGDDLAYSVADALAERGVPFLFASAYSPAEIAPKFRDRPLVEKPYDSRMLIEALVELTGSSA